VGRIERVWGTGGGWELGKRLGATGRAELLVNYTTFCGHHYNAHRLNLLGLLEWDFTGQIAFLLFNQHQQCQSTDKNGKKY